MLVHVLIRCLPQRVGTLLSQRRSLHVELPSSYRNRSESFVLSWGSRVPPERLPRRAVRGLGAHSPQQTGSSHGGKGFIRFTGFPEREEQYGELSCDSDDGALWPLLFPPGRDVARARAARCRSRRVPEYTAQHSPAGLAGIGPRIWKCVIPYQSLRFGPASGISPGRLRCRAFAGSDRESPL